MLDLLRKIVPTVEFLTIWNIVVEPLPQGYGLTIGILFAGFCSLLCRAGRLPGKIEWCLP